jgi:hypothetical protein
MYNEERYNRSSYHGVASSVLMWTLVDSLSRGTLDSLWLATVGLTDQFVHSRIDR